MTAQTASPTRRRPPRSGATAPGENGFVTPAPPRMPGRRNPKWVALGVVALCLGSLLSYVIYTRLADEVTVVAVVNTVHRGQTVTAADLTTVSLGSSTAVASVPAAQLDQLVGRQAVFDLVGGSLLPVGAVAEILVPPVGHTVVGIRLVAGRAPTGLLPPGSPVRLIALPPAGAQPSYSDAYSGRTISSRVISQSDGADGTSIVINVDVSATQAPSVALLAAQERLAVVRDADR